MLKCAREGRTLSIRIEGRFDYTVHREFRQAYENEGLDQTRIELDMGRVEHLDSSALGMLLVLRERAGGDRSDIAIVNCSENVLQLFQVANFQKMFDVS